MKRVYSIKLYLLLSLSLLLQVSDLSAQCANADFENGDFSGGWSGTYSNGVCNGTVVLGLCVGCLYAVPTQNPGYLQGPNNSAPNAATQYSHTITSTAGGNDPNLAANGATLPMVWTGGGTYSMRLGSMFQSINGDPDGETLTYTFTVTANNCNFTYHYAVVLNDGGHGAGEQPFFNIKMTDGNGNDISCADYQVDATTASSIGGFNNIAAAAIYWKPWTSVFIPLNNYIGQTVKITFTTRGCNPSGCPGTHYAYAYIDAECGPLTLVSSSPTVCGGTGVILTAPAGAATYSWTGPGVVPPTNNQTVTINQAGHYTVTMTTFGDVPCTFSLDTVMPGNPNNPAANFSAAPVCVGNATSFTDASTPAGGVNAWAWDFDNNGTTDATTKNPTHTFPSAGTYPVKLTVTWPPCKADTTINVIVAPSPTSTFTATSPVCTGSNATITYTGNAPANATYTWGFDGGTVASGSGQGPYQVNWSTGGTKNVTLTVSIGSCVSSVTTVPVIVNPFPGLTVSPNTTICIGGSATLTVSGATSYTWAPAGSLNTTTGATVIATPATTTTYTVTGNNATCNSPAYVTVTVDSIPTSTFTATSPVCALSNGTITYTGNASSGATYTWGFDGGNISSGIGQGPYAINWSTAGIKNVTLTVSQNGCTSPPTTVPVTVNPTPTSTFTATSPLCTGQNSTITYTGTASAAATYNWSFAGGNVVSGSGQGPYTVNWSVAGNENVTLSVTENGCTSPLTTVQVIVNPIPSTTFTVVSPVCAFQNSTITYTGTGTSGATYLWNFDGGVVASGSGQGPYQVNWATSGTKNITLGVTENGCSTNPTTIPVTVNSTPTSGFTVSSPVCLGEDSSITYTGTGTVAATYNWSFDGGNVVSGTGQGPYIVNWSTAGTKNVSLTVTENGCTSPPTTLPVTVNPIPTSAFTVVSPVCTNQNSNITYTGTASSAATYVWGFDSGNANPSGGQGPYQVSWTTSGTKNITLTVSENNCVSPPNSLTVTVNDVPVSVAGTDTSFCSGGSTILGTTAIAGYTYSWSPASGLSNTTVSNPTASPVNTGTTPITTNYVVTTTNANCSTSDAVTVTVYPVPVAAFTPPAGQCFNGNSFNFQALGSFAQVATFAWDFGAAGNPPTSTLQNPIVHYSSPGNQPVSLVISQYGCVSNTATGSVSVFPMPVINYQADTLKGCENFEVCFTDLSISNNPSVYSWTFGDGAASTAQNPCNTYVYPGSYTVSYSITSADGCRADTTSNNLIQVIANPKAAFTSDKTTIQLPENTINLTNQSQYATTYFWNLGALGTSTDVSPQLFFTNPGLYPVMLYAYNQLGCEDSVEHPLLVLPPEAFFIPNAFTPNGDGNNDLFFVQTQAGANVLMFQVFDRWGEMVHDELFPWDGTYHGKPCPPGVYVYLCKIGLVSQNIGLIKKGSVTLIR